MTRRTPRRGTGEVPEVECFVAEFEREGPALLRAARARALRIIAGHDEGKQLARCAALALLDRLVIPFVPFDDFRAIVGSPHLAALHELEMHSQHEARRFVLLESALPGLTILRLRWGTIDGETARAIVRLAEKRELEVVDIESAVISALVLNALRTSLGDSILPRPPPKPRSLRERARAKRLDLQGEDLSAETLAEWFASGPYPKLEELSLAKCPVGDAEIEILAKSRSFPSLVVLDLQDTLIGARALTALASGKGLANLKVIELGELDVAGSAVRELARAPGLRALRCIRRTKEWRAYSEGSREGRQTERVGRAGGQVVECVIDHAIWP